MTDGLDLEINRARDLVLKLRGELRLALANGNNHGAVHLRDAFTTSAQLLDQLDTLTRIAERRRLH